MSHIFRWSSSTVSGFGFRVECGVDMGVSKNQGPRSRLHITRPLLHSKDTHQRDLQLLWKQPCPTDRATGSGLSDSMSQPQFSPWLPWEVFELHHSLGSFDDMAISGN